jgi:aspartate racemase
MTERDLRKTVGLIGGIGPESTIAYYRQILAAFRERTGGASPSLLIDSIDVRTVLDLVGSGRLDALVDYIAPELERLANAGAGFAALASNTPHIVYDRLAERSPIPLLSIVEATADEIARLGLRTVALFGTRFTMQAGFYDAVLSRRGVRVVLPSEEEQSFIHDKYMNELLANIFSDETHRRILAIVDDLRERAGIEAVILGGTELPLLITDREHRGIQFLDTTRIHVGRIVEELLR